MPNPLVKRLFATDVHAAGRRLSFDHPPRMLIRSRGVVLEEEQTRKRLVSTVHVIDESGKSRQTVSGVLCRYGYCVHTYSGIAQFLSRETSSEPACLILDLAGSSLREVLAKKKRFVSAIALGSPDEIQLAIYALKSGAIDFLVKPIDEQELMAAVDLALVASDRQLTAQKELERDRRKFARLTPREQEVCLRIAQGLLNKEIAFEFGVSEKTVKAQRSNVMKKLEAASLPDVVKLVERLLAVDANPDTFDHSPFERACEIRRTRLAFSEPCGPDYPRRSAERNATAPSNASKIATTSEIDQRLREV
jgi:FixJ family two-component response regulator